MLSSVIKSQSFKTRGNVNNLELAIRESMTKKQVQYTGALKTAERDYESYKNIGYKTLNETMARAGVNGDNLLASNRLQLAKNMTNRVPELAGAESKVARIRVILKKIAENSPRDMAQQLVSLLTQEVDRIEAQPSLDAYMFKVYASFMKSGRLGESYQNVALMGPPGSGKTSSADLLYRFYETLGLLVGGVPFQVGNPSTLMSEYMGGTTSKTVRAFADTIESVLFIDEAYGITRSGEHGYGDEAVVAALTQMDRYKGSHVFMIAGYKEDIEKLLKTNPGLPRRFPHKIILKGLTSNKLYSVFVKQVKKILPQRRPQERDERLKYMEAYFQDLELFPNSTGDVMILAERFVNATYQDDLLTELKITKPKTHWQFCEDLVNDYRISYLDQVA